MKMAKHITTYPLLGISLLAACSPLLTACSQEEPGYEADATQGGRIEFRASFPELSTRAAEATYATLDSFQVSSFIPRSSLLTPYFLDKTFSKNPETNIFSSSAPECSWPNSTDVVTFFASSPALETSWNDGTYKFIGVQIDRDIATQFDFVTAIASGQLTNKEEENCVTLKFRHHLSRIELKAVSASPTSRIEIAGVRFGGVATRGDLSFAMPDANAATSVVGSWDALTKGEVEYIYHPGNELTVVDRDTSVVSILGGKVGDSQEHDSSTMLIPATNPAWNYKDNPANGETHNDGMYVSVLLRVIDITTSASDPAKALVYPFADNAEGLEVIYLAVDKETQKTVKSRLYYKEGRYFTDPEGEAEYNLTANSAEVKAFGWAALPASVEWQPGLVYTYTLDYTKGVGLHNPHDPNPGQPILNGTVPISVEVKDWVKSEGNDSSVLVPRK